MKVENWHRRHALCLASQLPERRADALAVIECLRELTETFLQEDAPEPANGGTVIALVRDNHDLSA